MSDWLQPRGRRLLTAAASILIVLAVIEMVELYRSRWPIPLAYLLVELVELAFLVASTVILALVLAGPRGWSRQRRSGRLGRHAAGNARATAFLTDDQLELLRRLHFYGAGAPGHRVHEAWLKARCSDGPARRFPQTIAELRERGMIAETNGWLSLTPAGCHEIDRALFLSPMEELTKR